MLFGWIVLAKRPTPFLGGEAFAAALWCGEFEARADTGTPCHSCRLQWKLGCELI